MSVKITPITGATSVLGNISLSLSDDWLNNPISGMGVGVSYPYKNSAVNGVTSVSSDLHVSDIKIGNQSLKESLAKISERLEILNVRPDLEKDWHELKELGDQYRKLEAQILENIKVWDIISK